MAHTCKSCGAVADDSSHLCDPIVKTLSCPYCGESDVAASHICKEKLAAMKYSCQSCGRVAEDETKLCKPTEIV